MIPKKYILSWHKRIGLSISAIVIIISLTGLALNHNVDLELDKKMISSEWIFSLYKMNTNKSSTSFKVSDKYLSYIDGVIYLNDQRIGEIYDIKGAVSTSDIIAVASTRELQLFTIGGELIERMNNSSLPEADIKNIALADEKSVILITDGGIFIEKSRMLKWEKFTGDQTFLPVRQVELPNELKIKLLADYRGEGLSLYRIFLDLHSGRIFGKYGIYIFDATAIGLILLTTTGILLWYRIYKKSY
jgi:hypothetical protein